MHSQRFLRPWARRACALSLCASLFLMSHRPSSPQAARNVLGQPLLACCFEPKTGYFRDGYCHTGPSDSGRHVVCAVMTQEFLEFTRSRGNDLITPWPEFQFPGLKPGDGWCLCALRWREAYEAGVAPPVRLESTHERALQYVSLEALKAHAIADKAD